MEIVEIIEPIAIGARALANWTHPRRGTSRNTDLSGRYINPMPKRPRSSKTEKGSARTKAYKGKKDGIQKSYNASRSYPRGPPKAELKCFDNFLSMTDATAGSLACLNDQVQGNAFYQRVGQRTYSKSVRIKGTFQLTAGSIRDTVIRWVLFYDGQPNSPAAFTVPLLFTDANPGAATSVFSHMNMQNRERFTILRDKIIIMPSQTVAAGLVTATGVGDYIRQPFSFDEYIKLDNLESIYNQTNGGTLADLTTGSLYLLVFGQAASNGAWTFTGNSRLRYYD